MTQPSKRKTYTKKYKIPRTWQQTFKDNIPLVLEVFFVIAVGLFVVTFCVWRFQRANLIEGFDLREKGQLGDAVNGLSAPVISFFSAILIYITFKQQVKANRLQTIISERISEQWEFDAILKVFKEIQDEFNTIKYTTSTYIDKINTLINKLKEAIGGIEVPADLTEKVKAAEDQSKI
jgi:hypothetical protein